MRGRIQAPARPVWTPEQARQHLVDNGITVTAWAKNNGFARHIVVDLLNGRLKGRYGEAHRAAVALRLKHDPKLKEAA